MIKLKKLVLIFAGFFMLGLGIIGMFVPLLPTTCFLIVSVWCFSKSQPKFSNLILENPEYGPIIKEWMAHKTIAGPTKCVISVSIVFGFSISIIMQPAYAISALLLIIMLSLLFYINSRPEHTLQKHSPELINHI